MLIAYLKIVTRKMFNKYLLIIVISFCFFVCGFVNDRNEDYKKINKLNLCSIDLLDSCLSIDYQKNILNINLKNRDPVQNPINGHPIGNGTMGTMVWTTDSSVEFQINRVDVFAVNKNHEGKMDDPSTDYCGGCGRISINLGSNSFTKEKFSHHLNIYEAKDAIIGQNISVRCFISAIQDLMVVEVDDRRDIPKPIEVVLSMWKDSKVENKGHVASYQLGTKNDAVFLTQEFKEKKYYCTSALMARVIDGSTSIQKNNQNSIVITTPPGKGKKTILISTAASFNIKNNAEAEALALLEKMQLKTFDTIYIEHTNWWKDFWSQTFVDIASDDEQPDLLERVRNLHLYYMASTSRGALPPKWNGSLFVVDGDTRLWGSQFWVWTTESMYLPLYAADAIELTDPFFNMYLSQLKEAEIAAKQRWGVDGAFYPETAPFDGPVILPEDAAQEYQDVFLGRKENTKLSEYVRDLGSFEGHLYCESRKEPPNPVGRYSWASHVVSSGAEIAMQTWWRYRYTCDEDWLLNKAYPLLKGVTEFYYNFSKRDNNGTFYIEGTNAHEDFWGVKNSIMDLAAIRGVVPLAIHASEILGVDENLREKWQFFLDHLSPYPMGYEPGSKSLEKGCLSDDVWSAGYRGEVDGSHNSEDVWLNPVFPFEDWTLETHIPSMDSIVQKIVDLVPRQNSILNGDNCNTAIRSPIATIRAGRGELLPELLTNYYEAFDPLPNGMSLFEGVTAQSIEFLGIISTAIQEGLLQSISPRPGQPEVINVFPAWPKKWDVSFKLLARGGFIVSASICNGEIQTVLIESRYGETCRFRNCWTGHNVTVESEGKEQIYDEEILIFDTKPEGIYKIERVLEAY